MIEALLRDLRQPEYIHVLINPLPVYGLAVGLIGLLVAIISRSRPAQIATLIIVLITAASAWPVYEFGEQAYDRVLSMADEPGRAWLDEHQYRGEQLIYVFYALATLALVALIAPAKWPRAGTALAITVLIVGSGALGVGGYIAYAGGKVRHREFRNVPPPPKREEPQEH